MTRPNDLIPQQYEVLKLRSGSEVVGMTRDTHAGVEITLPMICRLETINPEGSHTLATFYPYAPLSAEPTVTLPLDIIAHRSRLNNQFIPFYDEASARWFEMVDNGTIPLTNNRGDIRKAYMNKIMNEIMSHKQLTEEEEAFLDELEEEQWDAIDDFESARPPSDKKKIH